MKKFVIISATVFFLLSLTQCISKEDTRIIGVWQLQEMVVNGTTMQGNSLGNWLWEFNDAGGFLTDVAGMREKGSFTLKDGMLTLKITTAKNRPEQVYKVAKLDSAELDLLSTDINKKSSLRFVKRNARDVTGEKD